MSFAQNLKKSESVSESGRTHSFSSRLALTLALTLTLSDGGLKGASPVFQPAVKEKVVQNVLLVDCCDEFFIGKTFNSKAY